MASNNNDSISMAVFCDFENVALGVRDAQYEQFDIRPVLERLLVKGSIVVKKAYCDWERYKGFKNSMHEANFELIEIPHVRQSGKNSADIRLVVDALDLCYTKSHVDTFVIISGDSDFSPLVSKLRENAKQVIGVGVKKSTSDLLIANCDEFIFYDDLVREQARRSGRQSGRDSNQGKRTIDEARPRREDLDTRRTQALEIAMETYDALSSERGDGSKLWASVLKDAIKRRKPDFNESYYGFRAFGNLLDEAQARGLLRVGRDERSGTYVYRDGAASAGESAEAAAQSQTTAAESHAASQDNTPAKAKNASRRKKRDDKPKDDKPRDEKRTEPTQGGHPGHAAVPELTSSAKLVPVADTPPKTVAASAPPPDSANQAETVAPAAAKKPARQPRKRSKPAEKTAAAADLAAAPTETALLQTPPASAVTSTDAATAASSAGTPAPAPRKSSRRRPKTTETS